MKEIIEFLNKLSINNNKIWFDANKNTYKSVIQKTDKIALQLIDGISQFDETINGLTIKNCTYRIYRDIRFSNDKTPYKTHIGIYICRGGKKSGFAGYYFHIQPSIKGLLNGNLICAGLHIPDAKILKSVREEIDYNGNIFIKNINKANGFFFDTSNKLKKVPKGYDEKNAFAEYLKQKDYMLIKNITDDFLLQKDLYKIIINEFKKTFSFVSQLNKAVEYVYENY